MVSFSIYPDKENDELYFMVRVLDTRPKMYAHARKAWERMYDTPMVKDFEAICFFHARYTTEEELHACAGEVLFYKGMVRAYMVAHEMLHCAMFYDKLKFNKRGIYKGIAGKDEERLCETLDGLVRQFHENIHKRGVFIN